MKNRRRTFLNMSIVAGFYILFTIMMLFLSHLDSFIIKRDLQGLREGNIADRDYIIRKDISFIDSEATEKRLRMKEALLHPVYIKKNEISRDVIAEYDLFIELLTSLLAEQRTSEGIFSEMERNFPGLMSSYDIEYLQQQKNILALFAITRTVLEQLLEQGVIDNGNTAEEIGIIDVLTMGEDDTEKVSYLYSDLIQMDQLPLYLDSYLLRFTEDAMEIDIIKLLVLFFVEDNCFFSAELTSVSREQKLQEVEPVRIELQRGDVLLRKGTPITRNDIRKINMILEADSRISLKSVFKAALYFLFLLVVFIIMIRVFGMKITRRNLYLVLSLIFVFSLTSSLISELIRMLTTSSAFLFMPVALMAILFIQLTQDLKLTLLVQLVIAGVVFYISDYFPFSLFFSIGIGFVSPLLVLGATKRIDMLKSGLILAVIHICLASLITIAVDWETTAYIKIIASAGALGFVASIITLVLLPVFEHFLNFCTTFRLIELSDHNVPIMKRMLALAPGTYVHSLNVANLAEAACQSIGANSLVARVGAFYHDIGKIDQPEYFIENQSSENKHDDLKASLSAAVIKSHVKVGAEKARTLHLPREVIDIIYQHHGTSMIHYFFERAKNEKGNTKISIDDYRHMGPKPQTREAAIVMLSDISEAVTRTLKKPTVSKLEKVIWDVIMTRFQVGELNECELTLKDLEEIKTTFVKVLQGQFHNRIEYPSENGEENE